MESRMVRINIARVFPSNVCILSDLLISENKFRIEFLSRRVATWAIPTFIAANMVLLVV